MTMHFLAEIGAPVEKRSCTWNGSVATTHQMGVALLLKISGVRIKWFLSLFIEVFGQGALDKRMNLQVLQE